MSCDAEWTNRKAVFVSCDHPLLLIKAETPMFSLIFYQFISLSVYKFMIISLSVYE